MEVVSMKVADAGDGFVVRQFLPSRIERDVLAQVFELICAQGHESGRVPRTNGNAASVHDAEAGEQLAEGLVSRRRAA